MVFCLSLWRIGSLWWAIGLPRLMGLGPLQEFISLFKFFLSLESRGELPDLEVELDSLLDELEAEGQTKYQREQFKAYLMLPAKG
jgi:hypothetical protein